MPLTVPAPIAAPIPALAAPTAKAPAGIAAKLPIIAGADVPSAFTRVSTGATLKALMPAITWSRTPLSSASFIIRDISWESFLD